MAPPSYADLGKSSRDLFNKGYVHGFLKFDSTTKASDWGGVEFKIASAHNINSQKLAGSLDIKYKLPEYNTVITEKWSTDNTLGTVIEIKDQLGKGLKNTLDFSYVPQTAKHGAVLRNEWTGDCVKVNADVTLNAGPVLTLSGVYARCCGWYAGAQAKYDMASNEFLTSSVAAGRDTLEYTIHAYTNDGREFGGSVYHRVNKNVELGAQLGWTVGDSTTRFGLASKYQVNSDLAVRAKVDNKSQVSLSATHDLNTTGLKVTLSSMFGIVSDSNNQNKFGLGIEYAP
jgi:hypothetical protein